jgi:hypothetical protein
LFRDARLEDREAFLGLWTEFSEAIEPWGGEYRSDLDTLRDVRRLFDAYVEGSLAGLVVLYEPPGESPQGFGFIGETGGGAVIRDSVCGKIARGWGIYIRKGHRRKHIAHYLQLSIGRKLVEMGFDTVSMSILIGNVAASRSFENDGMLPHSINYRVALKDWTHG